MKAIGCCRGVADPDQTPPDESLNERARVSRAVAGLVLVASAGVLCVWPLALLSRLGVPSAVLWPLAAAGLWLGVSHLVAAATGYRGCPEIGAVASLVLGRRIITSCKPWERLDASAARRSRR